MNLFGNIPNWPIQRKLLLIILTTLVVSLALVLIGIVGYELGAYRKRLAQEVTGLGGFIAANSASTLAFDDAQTARQILNTLHSSPAIAAAVLYTADGRVFASYSRSDQQATPPPPWPGPMRLQFDSRQLELVRPIEQKGLPLGMLYLRADMASVYARLRNYSSVVLVVTAAVGGGAFLLQRLLQRLVSEPLLELSGMAERIAGGDLTVGVPVRSGDEIGRLAAAFNHMTSELARSYKDLQEKNAELERFTYTVSHDLKSPLVTVKTFLGYLEEDMASVNTGRIDKDVLYIRTAAEKMGLLLDELLEMSRIGRLINPPVRAMFRELVEDALQTVAGSISERGVEVQVSGDVSLYGDRPRLVEIWQNLIENAVKFMGDQTSPQIEIGVEMLGGEQVFFVRDNGVGINPRYANKIFGLFEKLDPKSKGTGLGLALVKRIVEFYQGRIWAESPGVGQGACFRFTLPQAIKERGEV